MTKLRRAAQIIEDLKTLGVITSENVSCFPTLKSVDNHMVPSGFTVAITTYNCTNPYLVKHAFLQEFYDEEVVIKDDTSGFKFEL